MNAETMTVEKIPENGTAPPDISWACVEIFGHRKHYGRVTEVERFGTKMLRIDVPSMLAAPLLAESETFETFFYGGASIFSFTPMTEDAARKWADQSRPHPAALLDRMPPNQGHFYYDEDDDDQPF